MGADSVFLKVQLLTEVVIRLDVVVTGVGSGDKPPEFECPKVQSTVLRSCGNQQ